jgi:hypothetical protein
VELFYVILSQSVHYWYIEKLLIFLIEYVSCYFAEGVYDVKEVFFFFGGFFPDL